MLRIRSSLIVIAAMGVLAALQPSHAWADPNDELTYFTFSAPVEIPGTALPAGTYMFKLADPDGDRNVVRVLSQDGTRIYSTFFAIPNERMALPDRPIVTFDESPAGAPEAIKAWFYPGESTGHEFVYPKDQGSKIAEATHQPVLTSGSVQANQKPTSSTAAFPDAIKNASATRVDGRGNTQPMNNDSSARTSTMKSLQRTNRPASSAATTSAASQDAASQTPKRLPKTASSLPLTGLLGLTSLGLGLAVNVLRKRVL